MERLFNIADACLTRHTGPAMVFVAADFSHRSFNYRELDDLAGRFAAGFRQRGLKAGDRVLLRLPNNYFFPGAFFGALKAGLIPVPSSPYLTAAELNYLITDSGAKVLVSDAKLFSALGSDFVREKLDLIYLSGGHIAGTIATETEIENLAPLTELHPTRLNDPAYLVYTSGTTGYPKGVLHAHRALLGRLPAAAHWFDYVDDERVLHSGKFNWTYVLGTGMMDPLYQGKTVVVFEGESSPQVWIELIRRFSCTTFIGIPTIFRQILQKTQASKETVPSLRHAMCAGEHLTDEVLGQWIERFGFPIYEGLGMSECSYYISQRPGDPIQPNSAGKIQPGHRVHLLDENLKSMPAGSEGMLCIHRSDPGLFLEYWRSPETNAAQFKDGWFLTGDYARADADGYLFFLGRRDEIIKSFGYRVSPFEIERVYRDYAELEDVIAFAERLGPEKTLISLCVQIKPDGKFDETGLAAWGKERLASYKLPKKFYTLIKFPRSANGKVLRSQIPRALGLDGA
jgi:acetyl-CoA synthetase